METSAPFNGETSDDDPFRVYCRQACKDEWLLDEDTERQEIGNMIAARGQWCNALLGIPRVSEMLIADVQEIIDATQSRLNDTSGVNAEDINRTLMKRKEALGAIRRSMSKHTSEASDNVRMILDEVFELPQWFQRKHRELMAVKDDDTLLGFHEEWLLHRETLIKSCTKLVIAVANKYWRRQGGMQHFLDLIEEGNIGLMRGVDKFSNSYESKLSTYAVWWIRQAIRRYKENFQRTVRVPTYIQAAAYKIADYKQAVFGETGKYPTDADIMKKFNFTSDIMEGVRNYAKIETSANNPFGENDDSCLADFIEDTHESDPSETAIMHDMRDAIMAFLATLPASDREIMNRHYGLGIAEVRNGSSAKPIRFNLDYETYGKSNFLGEIGEMYGVKGECIRQKIVRAFNELLGKNHPTFDLLANHHMNLWSDEPTASDLEEDSYEDLAWIDSRLCKLPIAQFDFTTRQISDLSALKIFYIGDLIRQIVAQTEWWKIRSPYFTETCFVALKSIGLEGDALYGTNVTVEVQSNEEKILTEETEESMYTPPPL
jgi:RNA polymerase sigma factor (sigma-70 family)